MAVRTNAATIPVTRERQVRRIAAVCDMHRAPFGSASDLTDFLRALDENKHLAMDFWAIVAKLTDEQSSQPSSRSLNAWILELIVEGVTNCSVAEMMAMAGEPRQAVAQLASMLGGEDVHRPEDAGPHVDNSGDFGSEVAGPVVAGPVVDGAHGAGASAVSSSVESPEFFKASPSKPPEVHDELKVAAAGHEVGQGERIAEARDRSAVESLPPVEYLPPPSPPKGQPADLHTASTLHAQSAAPAPTAANAAPTVANAAATSANADASTVEDSDEAGRRKAVWRWADSVTREEQQRPRLVLEPNGAAVGEVLPELREWAPASLQGPGPVSFQVSVPGAAPITVQVSLQPSGQLSVQTYEETPPGSFSARGFRAKYMAAEQNARLLDDHPMDVGPATLQPGRPLFETYGDEQRRPRWIWLAVVLLALGGITTGLVIAKDHELPTWQKLEASMRERYGAIWPTSPQTKTDEAGQSSISENPPAAADPAAAPTASQPAGGGSTATSSSAIGSSATNSSRTGSSPTRVQPKPASGGAVRGAGSGSLRTRPATITTAMDTPPASAASIPASNGAVPVDGAVMAANLISSRVPTYPEEARANGVEGRVVLQANILKSGAVGHLHVINGDPALRGAALEAVSKWRYRPHLVGGEPVDVITTIVVDFTIGQ